MTMVQSNMKDPKAITGKTVLAWLLGFFGVIFAANAVFIYLALGSFPGVVVESSYEAGQAYNQDIASANAQAALGWEVDAALERTSESHARLGLVALDRTGAPLTGLAFSAVLKHPTSAAQDVEVRLEDRGAGRYDAEIEELRAGNWHLVLEASAGGERVFRSENRLFLKD